ncbi:MAG: hypothetical protein RI958_3180 [Actinomycetota bacterium]|jgi:hypothetical protein
MIANSLLVLGVGLVVIVGLGTVVSELRRRPSDEPTAGRAERQAAIRRETAAFRRQLIVGGAPDARRSAIRNEEVHR